MSRRSFLFGIGSGALAASQALAAPPLLTGAGDTRALSLVNKRTGEWLHSIYYVEGTYIPEATQAINHILRDWREDLVTEIDHRTLDILSACHRLLECSEPFEVISGYRSAKTNAMLRRRSRGVARNSYHVRGMAVDISMKTRSVGQIAGAGRELGAGGVGRYSRASFVHLDSGPVRTWGG